MKRLEAIRESFTFEDVEFLLELVNEAYEKILYAWEISTEKRHLEMYKSCDDWLMKYHSEVEDSDENI